jgi:tight adherence protein C
MDAQVIGYTALGIGFCAAVAGLDGLIFAPEARQPVDVGISVKRTTSKLARWLGQIGMRLVPENASERRDLELLLLQAGYDSTEAVAIYFGARIMGSLALMAVITLASLVGRVSGTASLELLFCAVLIGFLGPRVYLKIRVSRRQEEVRDGLPEMLDLLLVCSDAGLGLEMAIARVGEELTLTRPLLADHLKQIGRELLAGRSKLDALKAFASRTGVTETFALVRLLVQSDALGTSISATLRIFTEEMQSHRMLKAEEIAQKVSAKLSMVLVICFLPAVMIFVIAPVIVHILATWRGVQP